MHFAKAKLETTAQLIVTLKVIQQISKKEKAKKPS